MSFACVHSYSCQGTHAALRLCGTQIECRGQLLHHGAIVSGTKYACQKLVAISSPHQFKRAWKWPTRRSCFRQACCKSTPHQASHVLLMLNVAHHTNATGEAPTIYFPTHQRLNLLLTKEGCYFRLNCMLIRLLHLGSPYRE